MGLHTYDGPGQFRVYELVAGFGNTPAPRMGAEPSVVVHYRPSTCGKLIMFSCHLSYSQHRVSAGLMLLGLALSLLAAVAWAADLQMPKYVTDISLLRLSV